MPSILTLVACAACATAGAPRLRELHLANNDFDSEGVDALARALTGNSVLEVSGTRAVLRPFGVGFWFRWVSPAVLSHCPEP